MKRLLTTTAIALVAALPVLAEQQTTGDAPQQGQYQNADQMGPSFDMHGMEVHASDLLGNPVYVRADASAEVDAEVTDVPDSWDRAGEIGDVIIGADGKIKSVVMDVGGFLGMGEKNVNTQMDHLTFVRDADDPDDFFVVYTGDRTMLETETEYDRAAVESEGDKPFAEQIGWAKEKYADAEKAVTDTVNDAARATEEAAADVARKTDDTATADTAARTDQTATADTAARTDTAMEGDDRVDQTDFDARTLTAEEIDGTRVYSANGEDIGEVSEIIVAANGEIEKVVIDVGGFLGLGEKPVALPFEELRISRNPDSFDDVRIEVDYTQTELENMQKWKG